MSLCTFTSVASALYSSAHHAAYDLALEKRKHQNGGDQDNGRCCHHNAEITGRLCIEHGNGYLGRSHFIYICHDQGPQVRIPGSHKGGNENRNQGRSGGRQKDLQEKLQVSAAVNMGRFL